MQFTIVQCNTDVPAKTVAFSPPGGTIGRSQDNDLVLPDESRAISRLQALVHLSPDGECRLTNQGSVTSVVLNGVALQRGSQVRLRHGDTLQIGEYGLEVRDPACQNAPQDDPLAFFADSAADPLGMQQDENVPEPEVLPQSDSPRHERRPDARLAIDPQSDAPVMPAVLADADQDKLIAALLEGMGLNNGHQTPITEEQMRVTGRMLSLFSQGTVALLSSRSILKRGVKADMTMILNEANNPFKILPSGKTVLMQMYQSQMPGFMPPEAAVRDALVDLQAHQLGMIAGIRAIIAAMLQSFNPQRLEEEARKDGVLPKMPFSGGRKAALWDYFLRHYQRTAGEIEDDFHTLFGEAFLHAYDMEVNQYKDSQTRTEDA
ncbi:type VI secretion system-associated FHA domain protein TagH [Pantoea sp. ICBG 828]|uniref:type VI secretion system-associated FHA domain protein TagH n=1 Tax=Pantoea TaxID=53335 RepID=UPI0007361088|nr:MULTISPECIES: type VI secretion system-associated FHA domain protein TagH [Pantoea]KTS01423.1 type VI secretion system, core protein [Pantoea dispersa]NIG35757.1 type VI secretion system-associated FHA domain protein TagH [Pantoea sp. Ap-959]PPC66354.1 type VI secretion system-associated FHA domain protein TagH [Pantoea sp. ICBG 828]PPC72625.1 type VI secretion system-associated FHA domain protein TagH [Pantoea sp. ICBG 985]